MKELQQFEVVIEKARDDEREALRVYVEGKKILLQEQKKLDELSGYKEEYHQGYRDQGRSGVNIAQINNYLGFLSKIDQTVQHQLQVIEQKRVYVEQLKSHWIAQRSYLLAIEKVVDKRRQQILVREQRREQKLMDEFAQRRIEIEETTD